ncbi:MAG: NAD(P)(+) transhydrogenase (Re/Si-specific) subunit alpha, partial [Alphaproteobacteria bacterium]
TNLPSRAARDATPLYARNLVNFITTLMVNKEKQFHVNSEDELIGGTLVASDGQIVHKMLKK